MRACCSVGWLEWTLQTPAGKSLLLPEWESKAGDGQRRSTAPQQQCGSKERHSWLQECCVWSSVQALTVGTDVETREKDNKSWDKGVGGKAGGEDSGLECCWAGREGEVPRQAVLLLFLGRPLYSCPKYFLDECSALLQLLGCKME